MKYRACCIGCARVGRKLDVPLTGQRRTGVRWLHRAQRINDQQRRGGGIIGFVTVTLADNGIGYVIIAGGAEKHATSLEGARAGDSWIRAATSLKARMLAVSGPRALTRSLTAVHLIFDRQSSMTRRFDDSLGRVGRHAAKNHWTVGRCPIFDDIYRSRPQRL